MIGFVLMALLGIGGGFAGLAWGWNQQEREADERRRKCNEAAFWDWLLRDWSPSLPSLQTVDGRSMWVPYYAGFDIQIYPIAPARPEHFVKIDPV